MTAPPRRLSSLALVMIAALLVLPACGTERTAASAPPAAPLTDEVGALSSYRSTRTYAPVAEPSRLRIPAIDVDTDLQVLGRAPDRTIEVPADPGAAGWWAGGPRPGAPGPAVLVGHVDSRTGPAVFFRLRELAAGDEVFVDRADGTTARFIATSLDRYEKTLFPSDLIYYPTLEPQLRLVTCGGPFDPSTGHYRDNVVVFADAAA